MSSRIGSDQNFIATTSAGILDDQANSIVSSDTTFGSSPLGVAARTQALYGIANANFNLTPPDPTLPIVDNDNPLPYWTIENGTEGDGSAIAVFDDATSTWGVELSLGTSITDAAISMTTRSFLLNDDNLALRQKALSVLSKSGTAGGTAAEWQLVLSAEYFSEAGSSLSTHAIGTVTDVGTWTSISGTTTAGGSAISSSAAYVDLTFTMTALGTVTGSAKATIKSLLLTTSTPASGGGSFFVTERFDSSGTWTRPTGVNFVDVVCVGGGAGGQSGSVAVNRVLDAVATGGNGGGAGGYVLARNVYVGDQSSVSVGVGAGGAGGSVSFTKGSGVAGGSATNVNGASGGTTTFGTYVRATGGNGTTYGPGSGFSIAWLPQTVSANGFFKTNGYSLLPLQETYPVAGETGGSGTTTGTGGSVVIGTGGTSEAGYACGTAGVASSARFSGNTPQVNPATAGSANSGAGGGGGGVAYRLPQVSGATYTATGGSGGNAAANSGSGGGGGGGVYVGGTTISVGFLTPSIVTVSSKGGDGAAGYVIVGYTA